jgi:putative ABC transport system permease protein
MKYLGLVWSNLGRKKLRTTLTLLSILVAFLLFGFLSALKEAFLSGVTMADADRLVVRHRTSIIQTLPFSYTQRIANIPGVEAVSHYSWLGGIYQDQKNAFGTIAVDPEGLYATTPEFTISPEHKKAWAETRNGCLVGRALLKRFPDWKIGDKLPLVSSIWGEPVGQSHWEFQIVGIYDASEKKPNADTSGMMFRYDYFDEARKERKGEVGWFSVRVRNPDEAARIAAKIDAEFANSPFETKAEAEGAFMTGFVNQLGDIGTITVAVTGAVFFTILLVAGNTMGQAVRERTEEVGVLKAAGFTNRQVLLLVLAESCCLALVGGVAGLALAWLATLGGSPIPSFLPVFYIPHRDLAIGVCFVLALGLVAGIFPAWQAMRLQIAEALRRNA